MFPRCHATHVGRQLHIVTQHTAFSRIQPPGAPLGRASAGFPSLEASPACTRAAIAASSSVGLKRPASGNMLSTKLSRKTKNSIVSATSHPPLRFNIVRRYSSSSSATIAGLLAGAAAVGAAAAAGLVLEAGGALATRLPCRMLRMRCRIFCSTSSLSGDGMSFCSRPAHASKG